MLIYVVSETDESPIRAFSTLDGAIQFGTGQWPDSVYSKWPDSIYSEGRFIIVNDDKDIFGRSCEWIVGTIDVIELETN